MKGAIAKAEELKAEIPGAVIPQQFENPANPEIHRRTTAEEIWNDTDGEIDVVRRRRRHRRHHHRRRPGAEAAQAVASRSSRSSRRTSPVLSGGQPGPHKIQGIGAGFVPEILDRSVIDEVVTVGNEDAFDTARLVARLEGIPVGISSGAALAAALEVGARPEHGRQEHRRDHPVLRRALPLDRAVRGAVTAFSAVLSAVPARYSRNPAAAVLYSL